MLNRDFKEFAALLNSAQVEYLVVGGYALAAHGHPRYTGDLDIWLHRDAPNITKVLEVLEQFGFGGSGLRQKTSWNPAQSSSLGIHRQELIC